jgi:hypothetical protein
MTANNLKGFAKLGRRDLYAASARAKKNGLNDLSVYLKALADMKYAIERRDAMTAGYVRDNALIAQQYYQSALRQATPDNIITVLTSSKEK